MTDSNSSEKSSLLPTVQPRQSKPSKARVWDLIGLSCFYGALLYILLCQPLPSPLFGYSSDSVKAVEQLLSNYPVVDTHIDLPELARIRFRNNASAIDLAKDGLEGHVDIPRLRKGHVGGFFWSVYADCPPKDEPDFLKPTDAVRNTLEQIDVAKALINEYSETFEYVEDSKAFKHALKNGKIASFMGAEGAHQLGNSLGTLRQLYSLGVRYVTLTHMCHNSFADSGGYMEPYDPVHGGLSSFGEKLVLEMNRLGMIVDVSHTSDQTTTQVIKLSKAPVIWSHSSARNVWNVARNVPDEILSLIGTEEGKKDALVSVNFGPQFVAAEGKANVATVADHVDHIGKIAGRKHVGLGSDFDGIETVPEGLEDVSKYPALFLELWKRGWTPEELAGLANKNLLRVLEKIEGVAAQLKRDGVKRVEDIYEKRTDL